MAQASIVLLKNTGVLPLRKDLKTIAVVGPERRRGDDAARQLLRHALGAGDDAGRASRRPWVPRTTRALRARRRPRGRAAGSARGRRRSTSAVPAPGRRLVRSRGSGASTSRARDLQGDAGADPRRSRRWTSAGMRGSPTDDAGRPRRAGARAAPSATTTTPCAGRASCCRRSPGRYELTVAGDDGFRLFVDGARSSTSGTRRRGTSRQERRPWTSRPASAYDVRLEYFEDIRDAEVRLGWRLPGAKDPFEEALEAARAADVVVFVGGLSRRRRRRGDARSPIPASPAATAPTSPCPRRRRSCCEALHATGKPVVLVLMTGSAHRRRLGAGEPARHPRRLVSRASRAATPSPTSSSAT